MVRGLDVPPVVVLPADGPLRVELRSAGAEVVIRPGLAVLRRELVGARGLARLGRAVAADAAWLGALARARGTGLVHSNTSVVLAGAAGAAQARQPHVWHVREIYARFGRLWPGYRALLTRAAALPCVSAATATQFGGRGRVSVVPDGLGLVPVRADRAASRTALGLPADPPAVAVVGRISDWKGQDVLVRALAAPPLAAQGTIGVLAGDPWPGAPERLAAVLGLADRLGVRDRLRVLGFRHDLEHVLGAAEVVAVPSTAPDPLPNSALEAAAAGCAVVASATGGLPEIVRDGVSGRLVAPGDAAALAEAVAELLADAGRRERLGAAAAADVRERFAARRLHAAVGALHAAVSR